MPDRPTEFSAPLGGCQRLPEFARERLVGLAITRFRVGSREVLAVTAGVREILIHRVIHFGKVFFITHGNAPLRAADVEPNTAS